MASKLMQETRRAHNILLAILLLNGETSILTSNPIPTYLATLLSTVIESGDEPAVCTSRRTLVIANHQSTADVPLLMSTWNPRPGVLSNLMWIMDRVFKFTNFGIVSVLHKDFFIQAIQCVFKTFEENTSDPQEYVETQAFILRVGVTRKVPDGLLKAIRLESHKVGNMNVVFNSRPCDRDIKCQFSLDVAEVVTSNR
ncbi:unnamed protein product [Leptidea sinapis]|uniref:Phospholipid/glycerol acyltransferase domain-containing protein n=1 Tax=Leptidea sinapis TaxID=189913 RepID=A0A5E4QCX4_9NEOP|nr:unnamed protein product [Leptidea sinapis]